MYLNIIKFIFQKKLKIKYSKQKFKRINERQIEYRFLFDSLIKTSPINILDVGSGTTALPSILKTCGFIVSASDNTRDYWPKGMFNSHYYVINDDILNTNIKEKYDFISCISTLEHIIDHDKAVSNMLSLLKPSGFLLLTFPYNENKYFKNAYDAEDASYGKNSPYVCQIFSRKKIENWLNTGGAKIINQEYWQVFTGDYWACGKHIYPPLKVDKSKKHQLSCVLIQKTFV